MFGFDLEGDWLGWGVWVFENLCIVMGEYFLEKFYIFFLDFELRGVNFEFFF